LDDPRQAEVAVKVNGEEFKVQAEEVGGAAPVAVKTVAAPAPVKSAAPAPAAAAAAAGPGTIKAPLPGVINSIKVQAGQKVKANDEICVIEAMKAMNVIRAPKDGTIARIHVTAGGRVAYGAPLMDIE
jgi:biotin carboxyl carrier protein